MTTGKSASPIPRRRVTLAQVAAATGLGLTTVSDILNRNESGRYSEETRERVKAAVGKLGYSPARAAQQLARGRSNTIGIIFTRDFSNPFFARAANTAERAARRAGYLLQFVVVDGTTKTQADCMNQMQRDDVEGVVIGPMYEELDITLHAPLFATRLPLVLFGGPVNSPFDEAVINHPAAWEKATRHLVAYGHRKIGYLCAPPPRTGQGLSATLSKIMIRAGAEKPVIVWHEDTGRFEDYYQAALAFVKEWKTQPGGSRPTAMLCANDQVAMTALAAFHAEGVQVPGDISLVGFDNLPESAYTIPALTSCDNHVENLMNAAVELLLRRIREPQAPRQTVLLDPELVSRNSVREIRKSP